MKDARNEVLANILLTYSVELQPGDTLLIDVKGQDTLELAREIIKQASGIGAVPVWLYNDWSLWRQFIKYAAEGQFKALAEVHLKLMKECDAWLGLFAQDNPFDLADIDAQQLRMFRTLFRKPVHYEERATNTKWCLLRFPTNSMAQLSQMSQEAYEEFYYDVCCLDYAKMSKAMDPLVELMEKADMVRIVAPGTDLTFSIKGIPVVKCVGKRNIPDGEIYTAPVRDSVNGQVTYNTPGLYEGKIFEDIRLEFRDGKIVDASCQGRVDELNEILDTDEGSRYIGEFSLGLNPLIRQPSKEPLFNEKIAGSFHLTPGNCYERAPNGNESAIHWDLVQIQTEEHGGGEIYFDSELIRKDGKFADQELEESLSAGALRGN